MANCELALVLVFKSTMASLNHGSVTYNSILSLGEESNGTNLLRLQYTSSYNFATELSFAMNDPWTEVIQPDVTNFIVPVTLSPNNAKGSGRAHVSSVTIAEALSTPRASRSVCSLVPSASSIGPGAALATSCSLVPENAPTRGAALGVALGLGAVLIGAVAAIMYKWWRRRKNEQYSRLTPKCEKALQDPGAKQLLSLASPTYPLPLSAASTALKSNRAGLAPIQERASTDIDHGADGIELLHQPTSLSDHTPSAQGTAPALELQLFPGRFTMNLGDKPILPTVQSVAKHALPHSANGTGSHYGSIHSTSTRGSSRTSSPYPSGQYKAYSPAASKQSSPAAESPVDPLVCNPFPTSHARSVSESRSSTHTPIPLMRSKAPSVLLPQVPFKISPLALHATKTAPSTLLQSASPYPGKQFLPYSTLRRALPLPLDVPSTQSIANGSDLVPGLGRPFAAHGNGRRGAMSE